MSLYSDFQKNKEKQVKKSSKSLYAKFKEEQNKVKPTFNQRMTGEPVKQKDGTFKATTGVIDVISGLPFVGPFARMGNTLGQSMAYNKLDDKTREYLAKSSEVDTIFPDLKKKKSEIVFDAGEAMLDAATGGISGLYRKGAVNTLKLSPLKARNLADLKLTRNQIMKRLGIETAVNTGAAYGYEVGQNVKEDKKGLQVLKPGYGTPLTAVLTAVMGSKGATDLSNKILDNKIKNPPKFNIPNIPDPDINRIPGVNSPTVEQLVKGGRALPAPRKPNEIPIEMPSPEISASQRKLNEVPRVEIPQAVKSPAIKEAEQFMSKQDYINYKLENDTNYKNLIKNKKLSTLPGSKIQTERIKTEQQLGKIWDEAHATPKEQPLAPLPKQDIPTQPIKEEVPTQKIGQDIPSAKITPEQPKVEGEIPTQKSQDPNWEYYKEKDADSMGDIEGFDRGTFKQWSSDIRSLDMDEVTRVALGGKKTVENTIPANAYLSVAKNIANETGDLDLAQRLATSNVKSKTAQGLVASKLTSSDNIVDDLIEIKQARMKKSGISIERFEKESMELMNKLKSKIKEITDTVPTKEEFDNIINSLICK